MATLSSDNPFSPLEGYPEHVRAIGMISIEIANLETSLGELLGSLLHISVENGRLVYLSPQSAMGRLAILENLSSDGKNLFKKGSTAAKNLDSLIGRSKALIGKRHDIIHHSWGTASRQSEEHVASRKLPFTSRKPLKLMALADLERLISDIRVLNGDVMDASASNYASWPPYTSQPKPPPQAEAGPNQKPDTPQKGKAPKPRPQR